MGILGALTVIALATWLANVFSINALLSSLIERPVGGSGAVRITLASEVGDQCFVEVFVLWEICFSIIFPWHVYFGVIQQSCLQAPSILL